MWKPQGKERLEYVTWDCFTLTMATGGIATVLHLVPFRFHGLDTVGLTFFFLNLSLYIVLWAMMLGRFILYPRSLRKSFLQLESLFIPAFAVSFSTILVTIVEYGSTHTGPWLIQTLLFLFWFHTAASIILSISIYLALWSTQSFTLADMTPVWIFPAYPLLVVGVQAGALSAHLPAMEHRVQVVIGGFTIQGLGFLVSLTIYSAFIHRLMTQKLPAHSLRPGMFVSVGPAAFTATSLLDMSATLYTTLVANDGTKPTYMGLPAVLAAQILRITASWVSLWLYGFAVWFFFVSFLSNITSVRKADRIPFTMAWYSFIFPQTALTTATFRIAEAFNILSMRLIGCVMTGLLILAWILISGAMVRAVYRQELFFPKKPDENVE